MGHTLKAKCLDCGYKFPIDKGRGFFFHLLRCDKCGGTKSIGFDELGEQTRDNSIGCGKYNQQVEAFAGKCKCGGRFLFDAPLRCPKCRSTNIKEGEITIMYD